MGDCSVTCGEGVVKKTRKNVDKAHEEDDHEHDEHDHDDDEVEHCPGMEEVEENCHLHECPGNFTYHQISYILNTHSFHTRAMALNALFQITILILRENIVQAVPLEAIQRFRLQ